VEISLRRRNDLLSTESNFWSAAANKIRCSGTVKMLGQREKSRGCDFPLMSMSVLKHLLRICVNDIERAKLRTRENCDHDRLN
jgi:hypothetical protein